MRWGIMIACLLLASCIPRSSAPPRSRPPAPAQSPGGDARATLQCHIDLAGEGIGYRRLDDRRFENGCTALGAVQLLEIGTPVTNLGAMTCPLARQFARWVRSDVQSAATAILGSPVRRVESFGTYACRSVNSQPGARISQHGYANAVDVGGFLLADGRRITIQDGWNGEDRRVREFLRRIHRDGCRRFSIGLGPEADAYHYNHLHFDMGRGPYCR